MIVWVYSGSDSAFVATLNRPGARAALANPTEKRLMTIAEQIRSAASFLEILPADSGSYRQAMFRSTEVEESLRWKLEKITVLVSRPVVYQGPLRVELVALESISLTLRR